MRTLIIGDVHGCLSELKELLEKLNYQQGSDRLIFVGDVVNKGPDSLGVLKRIQSLSAEVVLGNHELGFLNYLTGNDFGAGRSATFKRLEVELGREKSVWAQWMSELPLYIEEKDFIVVHGGIVPGLRLSETPAKLLTRIRSWDGKGENINSPDDPAWYDFYKGEKLVVFGHWAAKGLVVRDNVIGLDSGCVWGGSLSALVLPGRQIVQVKAHKVYANPKTSY